jgi:hypothetical protein
MSFKAYGFCAIGLIKARPEPRDIDLADGIPRWAALVEPNPIVVADNPRAQILAQILAQGGPDQANDGEAGEYSQKHTYHHGASLPRKCGGRVKTISSKTVLP